MEFFTLHQLLPQTDEFYFHPLLTDDEAGALVICNPMEAFCRAPTVLHSRKTLEEHIHLIQSQKLTKALVVAEDIGFLRQCPSLEGSNALPNLDFLKSMPNLQSFVCKMNVLDGDLSLCLSIPSVSIQNRKHYNYKNRDFSQK